MSPNRKLYNLALIGAGRQGLAILEALIPPRRSDQPLRLIGVADLDPEAPGIMYARRHNLSVFQDYLDIIKLPDLDIILNATGLPEISTIAQAQCPPGVTVLNCNRARDWQDFWDSISQSLTFTEDYPHLKIGIIGGGRGCQRVLQQAAKSLGSRPRLVIIGVVDPDPQARGVLTAQAMGIPTFRDCSPLLKKNPDLILELTGEPKVRETIKKQKPSHTQVIDHIQSRLFWELFKKEEDRLRLKVESEIKLADQRSRFQNIFDHLPDPVLVIHQDYTVKEVNRTFLTIFRKEIDEVIGQPCYQVLHQFDGPCDQIGMFCPMAKVLEENQTVQVLQRFPDKNGDPACCEITMSPLCPPEGRNKRVIEVIKDVTQRQRLEDALQQSEEQTLLLLKKATADKAFLETIVNGIEDQMMVINLDYEIIEVNRALLEMVGLKREEVVGKHCYEVSHHLQEPCSSPDHPCPLQDAVKAGKAASTTHVHFAKDGREHYIHVVCHPIFGEDGQVEGVIDLSRDITKEVDDRTRMLHDDKMTSLGKLSASVVHEINNPLTGILNFIKLTQRLLGKGLPDEEDTEQVKQYLEMVYNETSRVSKTVSNLLAFSRKTKPEFVPVDLNALLEETMALTEYQLRLQGIAVIRDFRPDLLSVSGDPGQLKQAFLNLFLNAQDAMQGGGTLSLETRNQRDREVKISISDTGVGIPKENFSHIFEPFYTTKKTGGVGLGLSVVYGIIRDHKGVIKVDSVVGGGTTFSIRLPASKVGVKSGASQEH